MERVRRKAIAVIESVDKRAPMASAPLKYDDDGSVDWGNMWDSFCVLALDGGPPHRDTMLVADESSDPNSEAYQTVVVELIRGIAAVSALKASPAAPGWLAIECYSPAHASWLCEAILQEHVQARNAHALLFVPCGEHFTIKGEIKNVITAVAKTTHYWVDHLPPDAKRALAIQLQLANLSNRLFGWMRR